MANLDRRLISRVSKFGITIPLTPVAWQRVKQGRYGNAYVPPKTRAFKTALALLVRREFKHLPMEGALSLSIRFIVKMPKRMPKRVPILHPITRPDLDNYLKAVKDALSGVVWLDDSQVVKYKEVEKVYDYVNKTPRIELLVEEMV